MKKPALALLLAALLLAVAGAGASAAVLVPNGFADETMIGGLDAPTGLAFLPDGRVLVIEQNTGKVRLFVNGHIAATDPALVVPNLEGQGERGLLGIAIDPRWPDYPFVYLNYTAAGGTQRIVRYLASDDVNDPLGEHLTFSAPRILIGDITDFYGNHNAGCLRFGPDGRLYASLGDDATFCDAADSTTLRGQILRLRVDTLPIYGGGQVPRAMITPPDNPFVASPDSNARLVYAFGLRNPFRFHIDPLLGTLYVGDVGENWLEELDEVGPGDFLGWPWHEGTAAQPRPECPEPAGGKPWRAPIAVITRDLPIGYAIISAGMYRPRLGGWSNWPPEYYSSRGDVFYAQYYGGNLRRLSWNGTAWQAAAPVPGQPNASDWATGLLNAVDFSVGPDGSMWWLQQYDTSYYPGTGTLHRIKYIGSPTAVPAGNPGSPGLRAFPNPFRAGVELRFALPEAATGRVAVHDLLGRRVRVLTEGLIPAGEHVLRWDGADENGAPARAGMYFARLERSGAPPVLTRVLRVP